MPKKTYIPEDVERLFAAGKYRYVCLCDNSGRYIIKYNPNKYPVTDRLADIIQKLNSESTNDGYYVFKGKYSAAKESAEDSYVIRVGNPENLDESGKRQQIFITESPKKEGSANEVLTWESALELKTELERLRLENENLKQENEDLKEDLDEMEEEEAKAIQQPGENAVTGITSLLTTLTPVIDRFLALKEKEIESKGSPQITDEQLTVKVASILKQMMEAANNMQQQPQPQ